MGDDEARAAGLIEVRPGYFRASWPMAAAAVIRDDDDRVLLVQPAYYPRRWLMPGVTRLPGSGGLHGASWLTR